MHMLRIKRLTSVLLSVSFWGLFSLTIFASIESNECEQKTADIFGYILMSFVIGWTSFMLSYIAVEIDSKKFPYWSLPTVGMLAWGGVLLSWCQRSEMEISNCKRSLWIIVCALFFGQLLSCVTFFIIYLYFKCASSVHKPDEAVIVSPHHPSFAVV